MRRDAVSINERVLRGEQGMEAIVGALTRCILAQTTRATTSTQVRVFSCMKSHSIFLGL
jgi:hypothetical protein